MKAYLCKMGHNNFQNFTDYKRNILDYIAFFKQIILIYYTKKKCVANV